MQFKKEAIDKLKAHGEKVAKALKDYTDYVQYSPIYNFPQDEADADLSAEQWEEKYRKEIALAEHLRGKLHEHFIITVHETGKYEYVLKNEVLANHWVLDAYNWNLYLQYFHVHIEKSVGGYPKNPLQWAEDKIKAQPTLKHVLEEGKPLKEYTSKWIDEYFLQGAVLPVDKLLVLYLQNLQSCIAAFYDKVEELRPAQVKKEEGEIIKDVPSVESPRHTLILLHELGVLKKLRQDYSYLDIIDLAALIGLIVGITDKTKIRTISKEIDAVINNTEVKSGKGGRPINKESVKAVKTLLAPLGVKIKNLPDF